MNGMNETEATSVLSPKFVEPSSDRTRSPRRKEKAYAPTRSTDPGGDVECGRTRGGGELGPASEDRASDGPAGAPGLGVRGRQDEHRGGPRAARDQADGRQVAASLRGETARRIAR